MAKSGIYHVLVKSPSNELLIIYLKIYRHCIEAQYTIDIIDVSIDIH